MSGNKPNLERRRQIAALRAQGFSLPQIRRRLGISKQCVHETLKVMHRPSPVRTVPCSDCGAIIISPGALPEDAHLALCLCCLAKRPDASFGVRLKAMRLAVGMTKAELAHQAGAEPTQIGGYEKGETSPDRP